MMSRKDYRRNWEKKLAWYRAHGIHTADAAEPGAPLLVTTVDSATSGLDMAKVKLLIEEECRL